MQRPNDSLIKDSRLLEQFRSNNIVAVFNLSEPGEHPFCGYGNLKSSGFPYDPEKLMAVGSKLSLFQLTLHFKIIRPSMLNTLLFRFESFLMHYHHLSASHDETYKKCIYYFPFILIN